MPTPTIQHTETADSGNEAQSELESLSELVTSLVNEDRKLESQSTQALEQNSQDQADEDLDEQAIEAHVTHVNTIYLTQVEGGKLEIGRYLFTEIFGGSMQNVLSKNPRKQSSFEQLAQDDRLKVDATTLATWVKAAAVKEQLESMGSSTDTLSLSQLVSLSRIKNSDHRAALGCRVAVATLTVKQTDELVNQYLSQPALNQSVDISGQNLTVKNVVKRLKRTKHINDDAELLQAVNGNQLLGASPKSSDLIVLSEAIEDLLDKTEQKRQTIEKRVAKLAKDKQPIEDDLNTLQALHDKIKHLAFSTK